MKPEDRARLEALQNDQERRADNTWEVFEARVPMSWVLREVRMCSTPGLNALALRAALSELDRMSEAIEELKEQRDAFSLFGDHRGYTLMCSALSALGEKEDKADGS